MALGVCKFCISVRSANIFWHFEIILKKNKKYQALEKLADKNCAFLATNSIDPS